MICADGIIIGSPVYSAEVTANMQALMERASMIMEESPELLMHKVGSSVIVARRGRIQNALDQINYFFLNHEMYVVGSNNWNRIWEHQDISFTEDEQLQNMVRKIGKDMAVLLKALH
ncbi:MAG: NAD(P)H-dependent oxidoreductase [Lachnospira sp.]|nr:NAD(P)H-dependent oxidoreductase [Lachnospira sp.]